MRRNPNNLFNKYLKELPAGTLSWIGLRPVKKAPVVSVQQVNALKDRGLEGDHRAMKSAGSNRQVTIISQEYISQIRYFLGNQAINPAILRRNLVLSNINLGALKFQRFRIGKAMFECTASCPPCAQMELALGKGGVAAMLGYGGICAKVIEEGMIKVGDSVSIYLPQEELF